MTVVKSNLILHLTKKSKDFLNFALFEKVYEIFKHFVTQY